MKRILSVVFVWLSLFLLTGCFDTQQEFTLNPDGSGKVVITSLCAPFQLDMAGEKKTPEQKLAESVKNLFENTKGVAGWREVTYQQQEDGRMRFQGTAYFADLNKVEFNGLAVMEFTLVKTNGALVLSTSMKKDEKKKPAPAKLSEVEMTAKIKEARASFQSGKPMLSGFLAGLQQNITFHLPGAVSEVANFKKTAAGDLQISFAGTNMIAAMESLVQNDEWWRKKLAVSDNVMQDGVEMDDEFYEKLFGQRAPVRAVIAAGAAKFDYAAEVAVARKEFAALQKKLDAADAGSTATADAPPAQGGDFKSLKVAGIRWVFPNGDKDEFEMRPFNESPGYALAVVGELPGAVLEVSEGKVTSALAADGSDILPEKEWDRKINYPRLAKDRTRVLFEVKVTAPSAEAKGFKEIAGTLQYTVGSGTTNVDLGITELKAGAQGTALGASIKEIKASFGSKGGQDLLLDLNLAPTEIIALTLVATDGTETVLKQNGYGGNGRKYSMTFQSKTDFPATGRLVAKLHAEVKHFEIPFKLTSLNLLGQPLP
jgi:hypothetical protein